jgi:hypothetical protein
VLPRSCEIDFLVRKVTKSLLPDQGRVLPSVREQGRSGGRCRRAFFPNGGATFRRRALSRPLLGYVDFRTAILAGPVPEFTCLLGTMVQEAYDTHPAIRCACDSYIGAHAAEVAKDIAAAKALYAPAGSGTRRASHSIRRRCCKAPLCSPS